MTALSHPTLRVKRCVLEMNRVHLSMNERSRGSSLLASFQRLVICETDDARGAWEAMSFPSAQLKCKFELSWQFVCMLMPLLCHPGECFRFPKLGWVGDLRKRSLHYIGSISKAQCTEMGIHQSFIFFPGMVAWLRAEEKECQGPATGHK